MWNKENYKVGDVVIVLEDYSDITSGTYCVIVDKERDNWGNGYQLYVESLEEKDLTDWVEVEDVRRPCATAETPPQESNTLLGFSRGVLEITINIENLTINFTK